MNTPLLDIADLSTTFATSRGTITAVRGINLTLSSGQTLGIVGESGSGKSVLGRTIMGLITDDVSTQIGGRVHIDGADVHALSSRRRRALWGPQVAMVFQDPMTSLNPVKRIGVQLCEPLRLHLGMSRQRARRAAVDLLREVRIPEPERRLDQYPHGLSGGMRQRVIIAIALACRPRLLIADEPTTALDVTVQRQILDLLDSLRRSRDMATILVSHDMGVIGAHCDLVAVMYAGRLIEYAVTSAVLSAPRHPYTAALIRSMPDLGQAPHSRLHTIEGQPPNLYAPPVGCMFAPRCEQVSEVCVETAPRLQGDHLVACHHPLAVPDPTPQGVRS